MCGSARLLTLRKYAPFDGFWLARTLQMTLRLPLVAVVHSTSEYARAVSAAISNTDLSSHPSAAQALMGVEVNPAGAARETARHELRSQLHTLVVDHSTLPDYGTVAGIESNYRPLASLLVRTSAVVAHTVGSTSAPTASKAYSPPRSNNSHGDTHGGGHPASRLNVCSIQRRRDLGAHSAGTRVGREKPIPFPEGDAGLWCRERWW